MHLKNVSKVAQTITIPCAAEDCSEGNCLCVDVTSTLTVEDADGVRGTQELTRRLAGSVTILPGKLSDELPDWVKDSPPVKAALAAERLRLVD